MLPATRTFSTITSESLQSLHLDALNSRVLVIPNQCSPYPMQLFDVRCGTQQCTFLGGHLAKVTKSAWDKASLGASERGSSVLVTGDESGTVCLWEIPEQPKSGEIIRPLRVIEAHQTSICQLRMDAFKIVTASIDGALKVFDVMTGRCLRTLEVKHLKGGNYGFNQGDVDQRRIARSLAIGDQYVIAGLGDHVKSWNFGSATEIEAMTASKSPWKNRSSGGGQRGGGGSTPHRARLTNYTFKQQQLEIRDQVRDVKWERDYQKEVEEHQKLQGRRMNGAWAAGAKAGDDLSEEDMMKYAMMVSMEEHEQEESDRDLSLALRLSQLETGGEGMKEHGGESWLSSRSEDLDNWGLETGTRYSYGSSASSREFSPRATNAAAELVLRSPRLAPMDRRQSSSKVTVVQRPEWDEEEELMYALELSKIEH
ncbi:hypothetical protein HK097_005042 [Rhizophlyctis rosea]|uniref:WD40 repeat-like protein n=1 Tax=Rhizophlyctis rosea TaxID=64517 RepID=A0AAD5X6Y9_9FUNG|nr:hypothetical protein HK097_005042 [Rhizophlyctis rosea]